MPCSFRTWTTMAFRNFPSFVGMVTFNSTIFICPCSISTMAFSRLLAFASASLAFLRVLDSFGRLSYVSQNFNRLFLTVCTSFHVIPTFSKLPHCSHVILLLFCIVCLLFCMTAFADFIEAVPFSITDFYICFFFSTILLRIWSVKHIQLFSSLLYC